MNEIESALNQMSEQLRALHDELDEGILVTDLRGERFLRANPAICRMLGYSEEELLALGVRDIHPPESLPQVLEAFEAMSQRRLKSARDLPCLRKDGGLVYANITAVPITFQDRPCVLGLFCDVTEEKRALEQLRASQQRYRLITDNVGDVIWTVDFPPLGFGGDWQRRGQGGTGRPHPGPLAVLLRQPGRGAGVRLHSRRESSVSRSATSPRPPPWRRSARR